MVSLSVCVFSNQSPGRLAAIVAPLRDIAGEVIVVFDDRVPNPDLAPLRELADTAISAPFKWPLEASLEWLYAQCSGDWLLRLDGDEVPSRALVDVLGGDGWHRNVTHSFVPRRWLVEGATSWIAANPWWPDTQLRLIKNEPGLMRFGGRVHEPVAVAGPHRVLAAPVYHLDLIDTDLETRRAKSRRYYRARPELRTHGGLAMGSYYTPELVEPYPSTLPVPPEDRPLIRAAIAENHRAAEPNLSRPFEVGTGAEPMGPVSLDVVHVDRSGYAGRHLEILVTATNTGSEPLDPMIDHPFRIGCQWADGEGTSVYEESRADIPCPLESGSTESALLIAKVPPAAGEYTLSVGALEEGKRWLSRAPEIAFTALVQSRVLLVGGYSQHRHLGDDLIVRSLIEDVTDEFPQLALTLLADDPEAIADRFGVPTEHSAARIHHANTSRGCSGSESVGWALADVRDHLAGGQGADGWVARLTDVIGRSDVLVFAAAGSLASAYVDDALWPRLIEAEIAVAVAVPVVITSSGIGPLTSDDHRDGARRLLNHATELQVRDWLALQAISDLGVDQPATTVFPDAATGFRGTEGADLADFLVGSGIPRNRPLVVVSVRADDDARTVEQVGRSVEVAARTLGAMAVLLPHSASHHLDDRLALDKLAAMLADDVDVVCLPDIPPDPLAADLIRNATISIGSRFHNAVLSGSAGRPAVLFVETEYDERRARGLAAMPGTAVAVMSPRDGASSIRTGEMLDRPTVRSEYPSRHPIVAFLHRIGGAP